MTPRTARERIAGPTGAIECAIDRPAAAPRGLAIACHPHPQFGGTLDNKVVQTIARACLELGWACVRFNFRGVGASEGVWDEGRGEVDDALAVAAHWRGREEFAGGRVEHHRRAAMESRRRHAVAQCRGDTHLQPGIDRGSYVALARVDRRHRGAPGAISIAHERKERP